MRFDLVCCCPHCVAVMLNLHEEVARLESILGSIPPGENFALLDDALAAVHDATEVAMTLAVTRAESKFMQHFVKAVGPKPPAASKLKSALIKVCADCTKEGCANGETWVDKIWDVLAKFVLEKTEDVYLTICLFLPCSVM